MRNIEAKELKIKFVESLSVLDNFTYENGNPFLIKIEEKEYFVFLKNISSAHFPKSPDVTRAQLPFSNRFIKIAEANIPFVILGYDIDNDVFVSWNPNKVKERLNGRSNVSLYCRKTLQESVILNEFKEGYLSTGEKILLFKRVLLSKYFQYFDSFIWKKQDANEENEEFENNTATYESIKLIKIANVELLNQIKPLIQQNKILQAAEITAAFYKHEYKNMSLKDWFNVVKAVI